ncbi:hypothetical protein MHYP_G00092140 [Metynnis hypsauchen]
MQSSELGLRERRGRDESFSFVKIFPCSKTISSEQKEKVMLQLRQLCAERISELSADICDQLCTKVRGFSVYSLVLDESTEVKDPAHLAVFVRGINDQFEVTEELLSLCPMRGKTTANDIFQQLCDVIDRTGLLWDELVGIMKDGVPSMTGRKNVLVVLIQRKLEEEHVVNPVIALHCIIHQQALCSA